MARDKKRLADRSAIRDLFDATNVVLDPRPIIVYTMRQCGCTYQEIADVFGVRRQMIEQIIRKTEGEIARIKKPRHADKVQ